ncbi:MAG: general secretion pathway protein GspK [Desulfobacterales bacterium]|nr:general secretion pathway protein GspK [Desulfobacterales bacterium]
MLWKKGLPEKAEARRGEKGGVVIIAVLTTLLAMMVLVFEVNNRARNELKNLALTAHETQLRATAASGVQIAMAILAEDGKKGGVDSVQELWADPEALKAFLEEFSFYPGELDLVITDELGKIQVNALVAYPAGKHFNAQQKSLWDRLLALLNRADDEDIDSLGENVEIVNSMKDWLDFDDGDAITGLTGAEEDYYLSLDVPYPCGNGPVRHLDELARIKGMSLSLLNHSEAGFRIRDFLTVFGAETPRVEAKEGTAPPSGEIPSGFTFPGRININTAEFPVVFAMMPETISDLDRKIAAESIVAYRSERNDSDFLHTLEGDWYTSCPGCENNGIDPQMVRTNSTVFSIASRAVDKQDEVIVHCVVERDGFELKILSWWEGGVLPKPAQGDALSEGIKALWEGYGLDF